MKQDYKDMYKGLIPMLNREDVISPAASGVYAIHAMTSEPFDTDQLLVPYGEQVKAFVNRYCASDRCKAIILTDDENVALKAAGILSRERINQAYEDEYGCDFDDEEEYYYDEDEEDFVPENNVVLLYGLIDIREHLDLDKPMDHASVLHAENQWNDNPNFATVMFTGIEAASNRKKTVNEIACCKKKNVFVHVPKKMKDDAEIQRLLLEQGFQILELVEVEDAYYETVVETMEKKGPYQLYKGFDPAAFQKLCRQKYQTDFSEDKMIALFDYAAGNARRAERRTISREDFEPLLYPDKVDAYEELMNKIGMDSLKELSRRFIALEIEKKRNPKAKTARKHMIFYGKPGTGKTTGAEMLAKVMAQKGIGNGKFVVATRRELIGQYVGQTAPKVAAKFEEAKGGILFVDEAGFFNQEGTGGYVKEALKEFIRYMEICEDVTVIFAMYPKEKEQFLKMDAGMTSRVAHIVKFEDYDNRQLAKIANEMLEERGYRMPKGYTEILESYFKKMKASNKELFGNARESRKLVDELVLEIALRNFEKKPKNPNVLSLQELKEVADRISVSSSAEPKEKFGFGMMQESLGSAAV